MELHKNGFIVIKVTDCFNFTYEAWPLSESADDKKAAELSNEADDLWFTVYDMQEIAPDINYVGRYVKHCEELNMNVAVLLVESITNKYDVTGKYEVKKILGFDCIGTVYYSYLRTEYEFFKKALDEMQISLNNNGLFKTLEDALAFAKLRKDAIESGENLENFWDSDCVRLSVIDVEN